MRNSRPSKGKELKFERIAWGMKKNFRKIKALSAILRASARQADEILHFKRALMVASRILRSKVCPFKSRIPQRSAGSCCQVKPELVAQDEVCVCKVDLNKQI